MEESTLHRLHPIPDFYVAGGKSSPEVSILRVGNGPKFRWRDILGQISSAYL